MLTARGEHVRGDAQRRYHARVPTPTRKSVNRRRFAGVILIIVGLAAGFWLMSDTERRFPAMKDDGNLLAHVPPGRAALFIGPVLMIIAGHALCYWAMASTIRHGLWKRE
jgi:hypothetical protein